MPVILEERDSQAVDSQVVSDPAEWTLVANRSKRKLTERRQSDEEEDVVDREYVAPSFARRNGSVTPSNKISSSSSSSSTFNATSTLREPVRSKKSRVEPQEEQEEGSQELGTQVQVGLGSIF
jgi:hypothetical protein